MALSDPSLPFVTNLVKIVTKNEVTSPWSDPPLRVTWMAPTLRPVGIDILLHWGQRHAISHICYFTLCVIMEFMQHIIEIYQCKHIRPVKINSMFYLNIFQKSYARTIKQESFSSSVMSLTKCIFLMLGTLSKSCKLKYPFAQINVSKYLEDKTPFALEQWRNKK